MNGLNPSSIGEALKVCRRSLISVAMFSGVSNLLMLTPAFFMLNIYDKALGSNSIDTLIVLCVLAAFMFFVMATLDTIRGRVLAHVSTRIDRLLAADVYQRMFKATLKLGAAKSSAQPLRDLEAVRRFATGSGLIAILDAPWIPIYITVLFLFHPLLGWIGIVAAVFFLILAVMNERATTPALLQANEQQRTLNLNLQKSMRDHEVVAAMGMLGALERNWRTAQEEMIRKQEIAVSRSSTFIAVVKTMRMAVQSSALAAGAYLALAQEISPGTVIAGSILVGRALQPVEVAIGSWRGFVECWQQVGRLNSLLSGIELDSPQMSLPPITGHITADKRGHRGAGNANQASCEAGDF